MSLVTAPRRKLIRGGVGGIPFQPLSQQAESLVIIFRRLGKSQHQRALRQIIDVPASLRLAAGPLDFRAAQYRSDRANHALGDPVLQIERVFKGAVEAFGPQMLAGRRLNQLTANADAVAGLAEAALDDIAHAQLAGELLRIGPLALVGEAGIAG